jgi:hypothetical protein
VKASALDLLERYTKKQKDAAMAQDAAARRQTKMADDFKTAFESVVVAALRDFATALSEGGYPAEVTVEPPAKGLPLRYKFTVRVGREASSCTYRLDEGSGMVDGAWSSGLKRAPFSPVLVTAIERNAMDKELLAFLGALTGAAA